VNVLQLLGFILLAALAGLVGWALFAGLRMLIVWIDATWRGEYWLDTELARWLLFKGRE
jgi:hypothetical protein